MFDIAIIIQIFVLLNPLASFPFLIRAFQENLNLKIIAVKAVLTAFLIAITMAIAGPLLFSVFGITLNSFRIAGGIVLIILGYHMITPKVEEENKKIDTVDSLTTIIATPMLTGPATISYITIKTMEIGRTEILSNLAVSFVLVGIVFYLFTFLVSKVNPKIINILSRIFGLFLMAVAIEMISKGIYGLSFGFV